MPKNNTAEKNIKVHAFKVPKHVKFKWDSAMPIWMWGKYKEKQGSDLHTSQNTGYHLRGEEDRTQVRKEQVLL